MATNIVSDQLNSFLNDYKNYVYGIAATLAVLQFLKRFYFAGGVCKSKRKLDGQTVVVTGANTGIGKETAMDLARRGARVILACRDMKKAMEAAEEIRTKSGNGNVLVEYLDLASFDSIRKFAEKIIKQEEKINILINNAGLSIPNRQLTVDGHEMVFQANHLGHFLLTNLLLDKIKSSAPSRIVNVSSMAHENTKIRWDDLMFEKSYSGIHAYAQSKLANVLFTRELANRLKDTGVNTYSLHPGFVKTEIFRNLPFIFKSLWYALSPLIDVVGKTPEQGAQTTIYCAVSEELDSVSGRYYSDCCEKKLKKHAMNNEDGKRLWEISEKLVNL